MRWTVLGDKEVLKGFLNQVDVIKNVEGVEMVFHDGIPTILVVHLGDGGLIQFSSKRADSYDGCREKLFVSTTKEIK